MRGPAARAAVLAVAVFLIAAALVPLAVRAAPIPGVVHVAPTGSDVIGCGAPESPCRTIQHAVNIAAEFDEIRVAQGTYTYDPTVDSCSGTIHTTGVVCLVDRQLTIRGGYAPDWSAQNPEVWPTIIDGQHQVRGVMVLRLTATTRLEMEGFVIQNGYATAISARPGDDAIFAFGGGLFADMGGTALPGNEVILEHTVFRNNQVQGANSSGSYGGSGVGGGVALRSTAFCRLADVRFEGNEARSGCGTQRGGYAIGGGFHAERSAVYAEIVEFVGNRAIVPACNVGGQGLGMGDALGGGAATQGVEMTLHGAIVEDNLAQGGSAISTAGGAFGGGVFGENSNLTLFDSVVRENIARGGDAWVGGLAGGGGIDAHNTTVNIQRTHVVGNRAQGGSSTGCGQSGSPGGGGLYLVRLAGGSTATIKNSVVAGNEVLFGAAGSTLVGGGGGGLWLQGIEASLTHLTISGNNLGGQPMQGDAILVLSVGTTPRPARVESTIIANHTSGNGIGAVYAQPNETIELNRTLWACNYADTNAGRSGAGVVYDFDPLHGCPVHFVAPAAPYYDYHLAGTSPAIDQALGSTEALDIDSDARPVGTAADIGADEVRLNTLTLGVTRPAGETLLASWRAGAGLEPSVDHYELLVECSAGAQSPQEGDCGEPIPVGLQTALLLTQLTDGACYSLTVRAYDASDTLLQTSNMVVIAPGEVFQILLPFVSR